MLALTSCGARTIEPEPICAHARILAIDPYMITPTGRVLECREQGWAVSQLEPDGTLTPIATLVTSEAAWVVGGWLEHDPISGRMWLLEGRESAIETPAKLYQFDAAGQLEWMIELTDYERPVQAGSLHFHAGSLFVSLTMDGAPPADPSDINDLGIPASLILERRDLTGAVLWARNDYAPPQIDDNDASALLVGVSGSALSMIATAPLTDYGYSYPLSVDIETGDVLWVGADGGDPLGMAVSDERVFLAWVRPEKLDFERWPERVVLAPTSSSVSVVAADTGAPINVDTREWPAIEWSYPGNNDFAFGWMGAELVSLLASAGEHGVAIHDEDGTLVCQGSLDLDVDFEGLGYGVGIRGRSQFTAKVRVADEEDPEQEIERLLLVEPLTSSVD